MCGMATENLNPVSARVTGGFFVFGPLGSFFGISPVKHGFRNG
jgi:hypothetical protein